MRKLSLIVAALCLMTGSAFAQKKDDKPKVKVYDFSGDTIEGDLIKPEGSTVDARDFAKHSSLIRIRKSVAVYKQAKDFFNQFLGKQGSDSDKKEAQENIKDCDKVVKQLEQFADNLAKMPKMPDTPPPQQTPAPAPQGAAPAGGAAPDKK